MKYAIIAAGEGSRLAAEGITVPKPLVEVNGEYLIDRLIRIFMQNDAEEIVIICNDLTTLVAQHLLKIQRDGLMGRPVPLFFKVKSTPSSMHSFFEISGELTDGPFVLTTVDTIFREQEFREYVKAFGQTEADGMMGVTDFIDDEKPLYVGVKSVAEAASPAGEALSTMGEAGGFAEITGFFDTREELTASHQESDAEAIFISGGIYGLKASAIETLNRCMERGESRMRNFQRGLIRDGLRLRAYPFTKVLDIDHATDIAKAEEFLKEQ